VDDAARRRDLDYGAVRTIPTGILGTMQPMFASGSQPSLSETMALIGEAGLRLAQIGATEGAAGNISVYLGDAGGIDAIFPVECIYDPPVSVPGLAGGVVLVTGSGRRLREIASDPTANLCAIRVGPDGTKATLHTSPNCLFERPTSEVNTHLAVHEQAMRRGSPAFHAIIHAQPLYLTYLSHVPSYQDTQYLNRHILRWQPETIMHLPKGVAFVQFQVPGSDALMRATATAVEQGFQVVLWAKHGVMACSDVSIKRAADRIEYVETGARYEYMNLVAGELAAGLTAGELRAIATSVGVEQDYF
jgi:rhamnulose-1-phosphate aldolase